MGILETIIIIIVLLWLLGMVSGIGGSLIHFLLAIAIVVIVYRLFTKKNL
jgi:hypothetical protein